MWLITLLILAAGAYVLVKFSTNKAAQQSPNTPINDDQESQTSAEMSVTLDTADNTVRPAAPVGLAHSPTNLSVDTGHTQNDVQEMIKILNLAPSDASRLSMSRETFSALRGGHSANAPSADQLSVAASTLRKMLA